jgi:BASS family bile acid:Na+ symporter
MNIITQVILPLILAFMMFSMGLDLRFEDFKRIGKFPKAFITGISLQFLSLPLIAFLLADYFISQGLAAEYAIGLIIIASCPGGVTSNMMTHIARGDTALSVSLTAVTSVASVITLPIIVNFALNKYMGASEVALPLGQTIVGIFLITTIPVALGMMVHYKWTEKSRKLEPLFRKLASIFFIIIILAAVAKDYKLLAENFPRVGPMCLILNVATMFIAYMVSKLSNLNLNQRTAITFECGFQNGTLAILVALTFIKNEMMMIPAGVYSLLMFGTAALYFLLLKNKINSYNKMIGANG